MFARLEKAEQNHYDTVTSMLAGETPTLKPGQSQNAKRPEPQRAQVSRAEKKSDAYLLADVLDDYRENALLLEQSAEGCRSPAVAELAGVQRDYSKRMEELLRDRLPRLMHGEEDPQEERAEAAALFAEYAIDFAAQGVRSALLAALAAMDQQMNCEEQQGKEHPV